MRRTATLSIGVLLLALFAVPALATVYPPGPGGLCPGPQSVYTIQNPAAACHPVVGDTVLGVGGIITGIDAKPTGFAYYIQTAGGAPWTGIDFFIGTNPVAYGLGDSIVVDSAQVAEYGGGSELTSPGGSFGVRLFINRISTGNPLPPFHVGTCNELQELNTNTNAEQWEGMLVKINGPLRVARNSFTGGLGTSNSFLLVDNVVCPPSAIGPCDSVFVDGNTLTTYTPPNPGTFVSLVQGCYDQRSRGYRIQLRDGNDVTTTTPPNVVDAYPVADDTIRITFDRAVTQASAENTGNYTLASVGAVLGATLEASGMAVDLAINNGLVDGDNESVTVSGIVGAANGLPMTNPASRGFVNGVLPISLIQAADPAQLAANPCVDRSLFAGAGQATGNRLTFRGTVQAALPGALYYITDAAAQRSGVTCYAPIAPLTVGRQYLWAGRVQEYFGETEITDNLYLRDEGATALFPPMVRTCSVLRDTSCDATGLLENGEDYEGMLVKVVNVKVVSQQASPTDGFDVVGPAPGGGWVPDTLHINNRSSSVFSYPVDSLSRIDVTGVLRFDFGRFVISPRGNSDFTFHSAGVPSGTPAKVSFAVFPNPARVTKVAFALPRTDRVELGVFDLAGRQVATLAKGSFPAGVYTREWDGRDAQGGQARSGVYFVRLRVGPESYNLRAVHVQ